jgi:hypothetical protein
MPFVLFLALAGSLLIHAVALFGVDYGVFAEQVEPPPLQAELKILPAPAPVLPAPEIRSPQPEPQLRKKKQRPASSPVQENVEPPLPLAEAAPPATVQPEPEPEMPPVPQPVSPVLGGSGRINFLVVRDSPRMNIGRAVHRWEFPGDGSYRLTSTIETTGLVALFKPVRQEYESVGRLGAKGLLPEHFRIVRKGRPAGEDADFDWTRNEVSLARDGSTRRIAPGTQDLLSLNYQLAYLPAPENGATIGVVTGKKYERYDLDAHGEEEIDTPAGHFRTLHLRASGETLMDIWIALDHGRLPVKIRFTDKKGDSYEQIATDIEHVADTPDRNESGKP